MSEKRALQEFEGSDTFFFKVRIWYANYKRFVFLLIPFFLLALLVIFKSSLHRSHTQQDFLIIRQAITKWNEATQPESSYLETLKDFLKKRPELVLPYEGQIVQRLLALGKAHETHPMVDHVFKRVSQSNVPYYTQFAKTTFLIETPEAKGETLEKALQEAVRLKEAMLADETFWKQQKNAHFGSLLFAFNLLRIALLSKILDKADEELIAWRELKRYAKWDHYEEEQSSAIDAQAFNKLARHFGEQGLSLQDYIKYRESTLIPLQKKTA